jgi:hypothetical protein
MVGNSSGTCVRRADHGRIATGVAVFMAWRRQSPSLLAGAVLVSRSLIVWLYVFDCELAISAVPYTIVAADIAARGAVRWEPLTHLVPNCAPILPTSDRQAHAFASRPSRNPGPIAVLRPSPGPDGTPTALPGPEVNTAKAQFGRASDSREPDWRRVKRLAPRNPPCRRHGDSRLAWPHPYRDDCPGRF